MLLLAISFYLIISGYYLVPSAIATDLGPPPAGLNQLTQVFDNIVSKSVALAFIALLIILLVAGVKFLTSGGDQKALESAQQTVTWGLLGMLFLVLAWLILVLINVFTGTKIDLTTFTPDILCKNSTLLQAAKVPPPPKPGAPPDLGPFIFCPCGVDENYNNTTNRCEPNCSLFPGLSYDPTTNTCKDN